MVDLRTTASWSAFAAAKTAAEVSFNAGDPQNPSDATKALFKTAQDLQKKVAEEAGMACYC